MKTNKRTLYIFEAFGKDSKGATTSFIFSHNYTTFFSFFVSSNPKLLLMMVSKTSLLVNLENCYARESSMSTEKQECKSLGYPKDSLCKPER